MLRGQSLDACLADIDGKLAAARAEPQDNRAIKVEIGLLEHLRAALLMEAGVADESGAVPPARSLPPDAGDEPS